MSHRVERAVEHQLLGSLAIAHATVLSVRRKNPFTMSLKESRQWSVLLKDVRIG